MENRRRSGIQPKYPLPGLGDSRGELTVSGYLIGNRGAPIALVARCNCGNESVVAKENWRRGASTRCNTCAKAKSTYTRVKYRGLAAVCPDGRTRTRLLTRISAAISRCHNPTNANYAGYGGRGIHVYEPWRIDRAAFLAYLVSLPGHDNPALEMDREDVNRGYEPGNLRFVSRAENVNNRRTVRALQAEVARLRRALERATLALHDQDGDRTLDRP